MTEGKRPFGGGGGGGGGKSYGKPSAARPGGDTGVRTGPKAFRPFQKAGGHKPGGTFKPKRSA